MTVKQVTAECSILLNAGHDTTQTSLSSFTYLLTTHPRVQEKLYKELRERLPGSNIVYSYNDIQAVPYLRACIDETLRVLPPTRYGLPRRTPASGAIIAGHNIAPDVTVSVPLDVLHLNEDLFISATEFIPERWIATEAALEGLAANPDTQRLLADIPIEQRKVFAAPKPELARIRTAVSNGVSGLHWPQHCVYGVERRPHSISVGIRVGVGCRETSQRHGIH